MQPNRPSRSALHHWLHGPETQWILAQLHQQFRPLKPSCLPPSWEEAHRLAGQQQVLEAIQRLCDAEQ